MLYKQNVQIKGKVHINNQEKGHTPFTDAYKGVIIYKINKESVADRVASVLSLPSRDSMIEVGTERRDEDD